MYNKSVIQLIDLRKSYGDVEVLKGINLSVEKGEVICIIGGSGSGKSTMLRCINFLEKYNSGEVLVNGRLIGYGTDDFGNYIRFHLILFRKIYAMSVWYFNSSICGRTTAYWKTYINLWLSPKKCR